MLQSKPYRPADQLHVVAVGQFKELVEVAEQDPQLCETLKKVLKLTRGWEVARDHAMMAVSTDNQMRIWYANAAATAGGGAATEGGLLFKCHLGSVDLENPVGEQDFPPESACKFALPLCQDERVSCFHTQHSCVGGACSISRSVLQCPVSIAEVLHSDHFRGTTGGASSTCQQLVRAELRPSYKGRDWSASRLQGC